MSKTGGITMGGRGRTALALLAGLALMTPAAAGAAVGTVAGAAAGTAARSGGHHRHRTHRAHRAHRGHAHRPASSRVTRVPVSFAVRNANTSLVPCSADGRAYTIHGTLFLPPAGASAGVSLYAHGLGFGAYYWHFTAVPGYDYATYEAVHGHASVIVDRLGYGASSVPPGMASCIGAQASILHQIIGELRRGSYGATGALAVPSFSRIGLVGHSVGGEIVQAEAESFHDVDALSVEDFTDGTYSPLALSSFGADGANCLLGGNPEGPGGPGGYSPFGATAADYNQIMFHDADPAVVAAADAARTKDPCGDVVSILDAVPIDLTNLATIKVPVAFAWGGQDALFASPLPWARIQESLFSRSPKVTDIELAGSGHAVTLGRQAPQLQRAMDAWLTANSL